MSVITMLIYLAYISNFFAALALLYSKRNNTSNVYAWLMVLIFFPFIGFIVYFFCGSTYKVVRHSNKYNFDKIEKRHNEIAKKILGEEKTNERFSDMINLTSRFDTPLYTENNKVTYFDNATDKFKSMFEDIENAKRSVNVEYFIFLYNNDITNRLIALLAKKATEGVSVKVIYDRFGDFKTTRKAFDPIIAAGGEVYAFLPSFITSVIQLNDRNHRKIVVIDDTIAYTGGINVGDEYMSLNPRLSPWRDSAVRIEGEAAIALQMRLLSDFYYLKSQVVNKTEVLKYINSEEYFKTFNYVKTSNEETGVQIISSNPNPDFSDIKDAYYNLISRAKKYVYIHSPYFVPDQTMIDALRVAAKSGVDVRIIIPGKPDSKLPYYVALSNVEFMLENGVRVYTSEGFIHSKMFIADDEIVSVGTANLDIRSFDLNYEVNAFIYDEKIVETCRLAFFEDLKTSKEIDVKTFKNRGFIQKTKEAIAKFIAPLV